VDAYIYESFGRVFGYATSVNPPVKRRFSPGLPRVGSLDKKFYIDSSFLSAVPLFEGFNDIVEPQDTCIVLLDQETRIPRLNESVPLAIAIRNDS